MIVERMRAPEAGWAAPPSLAPAFRGGAGRLDSRRSGQTAGFHALARRGSARGLLFWGRRWRPQPLAEPTGWSGRRATGVLPQRVVRQRMPLPPGGCHWAQASAVGGLAGSVQAFRAAEALGPGAAPMPPMLAARPTVRGTTVSSPRRCSRHTPSVRLPEAFWRPPGRVPRRGRVPPPPRGPRPRGHAQGAEDSRSRGAQPRCACVAPLAPKVREPWACCDAWQSPGGNPSPQFPRAVILTEGSPGRYRLEPHLSKKSPLTGTTP